MLPRRHRTRAARHDDRRGGCCLRPQPPLPRTRTPTGAACGVRCAPCELRARRGRRLHPIFAGRARVSRAPIRGRRAMRSTIGERTTARSFRLGRRREPTQCPNGTLPGRNARRVPQTHGTLVPGVPRCSGRSVYSAAVKPGAKTLPFRRGYGRARAPSLRAQEIVCILHNVGLRYKMQPKTLTTNADV